MRYFKKFRTLSLWLLFVICFFPNCFLVNEALAQTPADQVIFSLNKENISSPNGQIHRVRFGIQKGSATAPVCLTTTLGYNTEIFKEFEAADLISTGVTNKTITPNLSKNDLGILTIGVGVEDYDDKQIPDGNLFYIDFRVKDGAEPKEDDVAFKDNKNIGPNQASDKEAQLLRVAKESGEIFDTSLDIAASDKSSGGGGGSSCFIGALFGWHK